MALGWITLPLIFHQIYPSPWWRITKVHLKTILPCLKSLEGFLAAHRTVWPWQMRSPGSVSLKQYFHEFPSITLNFQDFLRCSLFYSYMILLKCGCVKVAQSCPTLCDPMDYTVQGILQGRILQWVAFPFSRGSSQPRGRNQVSHIAGGFFTSWATRKPVILQSISVLSPKQTNLFLAYELQNQ